MPILVETLKTLDYPNLEFLVSDRHHDDDAIDQLQAMFGHDPRFRFFLAEDRMDWVGHYNFLLQEATGDYFLWVSHDDSYSPNYLAELARALDEHPDAVVAYGLVERVTLDGKPLPRPLHPGKRDAGGSSPIRSYRITLNVPHVFHGLFRRQIIAARQLWIRRTPENVAADALWVFALTLLGRVEFAPACHFIKRYYPTSTHKLWANVMRPAFVFDFARVTGTYLDDHAPSLFQRLTFRTMVWLVCCFWYARLTARNWLHRPQGAPSPTR